MRKLGNSTLVRASVLMPAFGYMLLLNENVHHYLTIKFDGRLLNYLPDVWRIWLLFYGSFFIAIATLAYSAFCPSEIKRYGAPFDMAEGEAALQLGLGQYEMEAEYIKIMRERLGSWQKSLFIFARLPQDQPNFHALTQMERMSNMFIYHWHLKNTEKPRARIAILALFWIGFALLALPAVFTFVQVTALAVSRLLT